MPGFGSEFLMIRRRGHASSAALCWRSTSVRWSPGAPTSVTCTEFENRPARLAGRL